MAPLAILVIGFLVIFLLNKFALSGRMSLSLAGRIAMSMMLVATGTAHFTSTGSMTEMLPDFMPYQREMIYFTGVCELAAAVGLLIPWTTKLTAVMLIVFFVAVLPANIIGSLRAVDFAGMSYGPIYLVLRIPMQIFFIWWVWYFGIFSRDEPRKSTKDTK